VANEQQGQAAPSSKTLIERNFQSVNISTSPTSLRDGECAQLENLMPYAPGNLAVVPGQLFQSTVPVLNSQWWATIKGSNTLYYSDDLATWNTTTRTPNVSSSSTMAPLGTGPGKAVIFSNGTNNDEVITSFAFPIVTTLGTAPFNPTVAQYYRDIDAIIALQFSEGNTTSHATSIWISTDGGQSFQSYPLPAGGTLGITRLNSGRWLVTGYASTDTFWYTDSKLPTGGWINGASFPLNVNAYTAIASNGTTAIVMDNLGSSYYTTDGLTLTTVTLPISAPSTFFNGCTANGNTFVFAIQQPSGSSILRSADSGKTWTNPTLPYGVIVPTVMIYADGAFVFNCEDQQPTVSLDDGLTWTTISALPSGAQVGVVEFIS